VASSTPRLSWNVSEGVRRGTGTGIETAIGAMGGLVGVEICANDPLDDISSRNGTSSFNLIRMS
jgi:hypothetical protein